MQEASAILCQVNKTWSVLAVLPTAWRTLKVARREHLVCSFAKNNVSCLQLRGQLTQLLQKRYKLITRLVLPALQMNGMCSDYI